MEWFSQKEKNTKKFGHLKKYYTQKSWNYFFKPSVSWGEALNTSFATYQLWNLFLYV